MSKLGGTNVSEDTDKQTPGQVNSVVGGTGITVNSADPTAPIVNADTVASTLTTKGDVQGFDTAENRIPIGANDQVLTADSAQALGLKWAAAPGGDPLTTKGDLFGFDTDAARIPVGTNGQHLEADSAQALGVKWATPAAGATFQGALVAFNANQSISSSTDTILIWEVETYDVGGWHDNVTNNTRLTVPSGVTRVRLTAGFRDASSVTGQFIIRMLKNGSSFAGNPIQETDTAGGDACSIASPVVDVVATDFFEVQVFVVGARTIEPDDAVFFSIEQVS